MGKLTVFSKFGAMLTPLIRLCLIFSVLLSGLYVQSDRHTSPGDSEAVISSDIAAHPVVKPFAQDTDSRVPLNIIKDESEPESSPTFKKVVKVVKDFATFFYSCSIITANCRFKQWLAPLGSAAAIIPIYLRIVVLRI